MPAPPRGPATSPGRTWDSLHKHPVSGQRICSLDPHSPRWQRPCRGTHQPDAAVFWPKNPSLVPLIPKASRIKLSVTRSSLLRTLHARPSPIVFSYLCGARLLGGNSSCGFCCSISTRTMNATSSSSESKCSAWCDTRCSTRPLKWPCSGCASACSCTTNALLAGREGRLLVMVSPRSVLKANGR